MLRVNDVQQAEASVCAELRQGESIWSVEATGSLCCVVRLKRDPQRCSIQQRLLSSHGFYSAQVEVRGWLLCAQVRQRVQTHVIESNELSLLLLWYSRKRVREYPDPKQLALSVLRIILDT